MINLFTQNTGYTPPKPNVTQSTLAPLGNARAMSQLQSSLPYRQAGLESKRQQEQNLEMGRPTDVRDVARYEKLLEEDRKRLALAQQPEQTLPQLAQAKKNFETNVF